MKTNQLETHGRDWPILLGVTMACLWIAPRPVVADALPKWVRGQLGPDEFVGVSSEREDEDAALREALTNAQVQVAQSLGMMLDTLSLQESSDEGNGVTGTTHYSSTDKIQASTRTLLALKAEQRHVEKQCPRGEPCRWKAWVLVRYSSAGHRKAMRRRIDEAIDAVRDLALAGLESIRNDDWASALQLFGKLDQPGQELEALTGVDSGDLAELRREREAARRKVQAILSTLHLNANRGNR